MQQQREITISQFSQAYIRNEMAVLVDNLRSFSTCCIRVNEALMLFVTSRRGNEVLPSQVGARSTVLPGRLRRFPAGS